MKKPTPIRLSVEDKKMLEMLASRNDRSMASMVRVLIHQEAKKQGVAIAGVAA